MAKGDLAAVGSFHYLPCSVVQGGVRNVYFKMHTKGGAKNTLFVTNLPPYCPLVEVLRVFSQFGEITSLQHGSLNKKALGKVKTQATTRQLTDLDLNLNIAVGRTFKFDHDLKYKKINDIRAIEAHRAEIRRNIRNKTKGLLIDKEKKEETELTASEEEKATNEEEQSDFRALDTKPSFLGCEYLRISFKDKKEVKKMFELSLKDFDKYDLVIDLLEGEEDEEEATTAVSRWIKEYHETSEDIKTLENHSNSFMAQFDEKRRKEAEHKAKMAKMDEDGWTVVTSSSKRRKANDGTIKVSGVKADEVILRRSKKSKILANFYKFQQHEERRERLGELRKQFEDDKNRIEQMKAQRDFRPF